MGFLEIWEIFTVFVSEASLQFVSRITVLCKNTESPPPSFSALCKFSKTIFHSISSFGGFVEENCFPSIKGDLFGYCSPCGVDESFLKTCRKSLRFYRYCETFSKENHFVKGYVLHFLFLAPKRGFAILEGLLLGFSAP